MRTLRLVAQVNALLLLFSIFVVADVPPFANRQAAKDGAYGYYPRQSYLSDPSVVGPVANVLVAPQEGVSPSRYVGWAPHGIRFRGKRPTLIDATSFATTWIGPAYDRSNQDITVQGCNGSQYLTWWAGDTKMRGSWYIVNNKYEILYNLTGSGPLKFADSHDMFITPQCTAIIVGVTRPKHHLTSYNTSDTWIVDSHFQEIRLDTGELLFHWQASKHIEDVVREACIIPQYPRMESTELSAFDWFHLNSVSKDHLGNYLISARHSGTIYYISGLDGSIIWRLGGRNNDFKDMSGGHATDFRFQHHARWIDHNLTRLSIFDNRQGEIIDHHYPSTNEPLSRGLILKLDQTNREVRLEHTYYATRNISSIRKGSMQVLEDSPVPGNVILGYGDEPAWTEFSANGTVVADVSFGPLGLNRKTVDNYRALKVNWTGLPYWDPKIAPGPRPNYIFNKARETFSVRLFDESGEVIKNDTVYFSWNGATEIKFWIILASNDTKDLSLNHFLAEVTKTGFEDHVFIGTDTKYVRALAVDKLNAVLGTTPVLEMHGFRLSNNKHNDIETYTRPWQARVAKGPNASSVDGCTLIFFFALFALIYWKAQPLRTILLYLCSYVGIRERYRLAHTNGYKLIGRA